MLCASIPPVCLWGSSDKVQLYPTTRPPHTAVRCRRVVSRKLGQVQALGQSLKINTPHLLGANFKPMPPNAATGAAGTPGGRSGFAEEPDILDPDKAKKLPPRSRIDDESCGRDADPWISQPPLNERGTFLEMSQVKALV